MRRNSLLIVTAAVSLLALAGCGRASLSTTKQTYRANVLVAPVKGHTNAKTVTYQIDQQTPHKQTVHDGTFVIQVPSTTKRQQVKLSANGNHQTVQVAAVKPLTNYQSLQQAYNQALTGSKMSPAAQKQAVTLQKAAAQLKQQPNPELAATVQQLQPQVQAAMAQAKTAAKGQLLPVATPKNGLHDVVSTKVVQTRMNVQDGQVMAASMMVPTKAFKSKAGQKEFGTSFALMAGTTGADAKKVMKEFGKQTKAAKKGNTTVHPIYSNGVKFTFGVSTSKIYLFMEK
ncbi:hypothetical protein [Furfurilactobacillus curtus]|uniref:Lipoprotein n=1 Tax=Furfurilactobacillus curtus TaxID=1746200 RepID=A0ABQ5JLI3_9LACO